MTKNLQASFLVLFSLLILSCNSEDKKEKYTKISKTSTQYIDGYVGDKNCVACHQTEVDLWKGSHHDLAMQIADETTVLGDFNNLKMTLDDVEYFFFKKENDFIVKIKEIDTSEKEYKITYTFGVTPLQQYLVDFENGKKQVLRVTWNVIKKKWYHQYKGDKIQPHDWLHWTKSSQNWNTMCAECHSTNLKKNYSIEGDAFNTTYSSINVSCESCHGPAEKHLAWAENPSEDKNSYILSPKKQKEQLNLCATCHARRAKLTENYVPGEKFENQYMVQNITNNFYHGDGQIDDEDYVYGSFMQSKMFDKGVKCNDCHNVHTLKLKFEGNKLCLQCHVPTNYETEKHYFHKQNTEASLCVNCHMTGKNYMGNDFRRDHSFRIPRPDQSEKYGTPNACTVCHTDKSNQWAADVIKDKFGNKRAPHFSDALLMSTNNNLTEGQRNQLDIFINDLNYPEIARATVIENLDYYAPEQFKTLLIALKDSSAIVRYNALLKFRSLPPQDRLSIALKHLNDSIKLVRIGATQLVIGLDENTLSGIDKSNFIKSRNELQAMLFANADFSTGRLQLGDYYFQNNDINNAIKHYEMALKKDRLLLPVYSNLATSYSLNNNFEKASETLETWIGLDTENSRPHYLKALLNFENKNDEVAVSELKIAIKLNPNDLRSLYNLATYYFQDNKDLKQAEASIKSALKIDSENPDFNYLLALIYKEQGQATKANTIMLKLKVNQY
ncbi:MAG: tetratricopeptide repeat protein [Flavobacteriaceae bacterium]|nr:tetratricopeptide repeat protein [Flavobacteriaceae bacterium]